jgi:hypothetical protein
MSPKRFSRWRSPWIVVAVLGVVLVALILLSIVWFPSLIVRDTDRMERKDVLAAENAVRATLLTAIAGTLFLVTAIFTWRQIRQAREGQITDRYEAAVRLVGSEGLAERIGGIYALQRIAEDSARDEPTVVRLLSAFCRERAKEPDVDDSPPDPHPELLIAPGSLEDRHPDVQTALDVLADEAITSPADVRGAHLEGSSLIWAHLEGASLIRAHLEGAYLSGAHLEGAYLSWAHLEGADLEGAHLKGANLIGTHLERANLSGAHLEKVGLGGAHLEGTYLFEAHLEGANLLGAYLEGANLRRARLEGAYLGEAHLERANLTDATWDTKTQWPPGYPRSTTDDPGEQGQVPSDEIDG